VAKEVKNLMVKDLIKKIIPKPLINLYHFTISFFSALFFGFPSKKIKVIGVTGTDGKTTTTEMIAKILEEAGYKVALLNSVRFKIGQREKINTLRMTMPGRGFIQKFLNEAQKEGCEFAVIEVTSEGIKQYRHKFIDFKIAVFTNLSPEHIESHGSFEKYREAKGELFKATKDVHVLNGDDKEVQYFLNFPAKKRVIFTKDPSKLADFQKTGMIILAENIKENPFLSFTVKDVEFNLNLLGEFNVYNALAGISVALSQGISLEICKKALEKFKGVPGRMEEVISEPFKVIVDYAVTPKALEKVYQTLTSNFKLQASNKLICVLGACGGGRDKWKRPVLGEIALKYCDEIIVTNEDPYDEDPWQIIEEVASGTKGKAKKILDRREAIKTALKLAKEGDVVIITGKGCEPSICIKGKKIPWDDREVVKEEFKKIYEKIRDIRA
jgi:UDP-N-acetylmuramoyl-L-alanyl-D-glutamate--2,6-diaminopimelate ligase